LLIIRMLDNSNSARVRSSASPAIPIKPSVQSSLSVAMSSSHLTLSRSISIAFANYPAPRCDGHSFAVDPSGRIIAMADTSPGFVLATFDLGAIRKARRQERFRWQI
jgi:predicted amidohydrolase